MNSRSGQYQYLNDQITSKKGLIEHLEVERDHLKEVVIYIFNDLGELTNEVVGLFRIQTYIF